MKILAFGLDKSALDLDSPLARRLVGYGGEVERYDLIVPSPEYGKKALSVNVDVYGSGGKSKLAQLARLKLLAMRLMLKNHYDVLSVQDQHYLGLLAWLLSGLFGLGLEIQVHGWERKSGLRLIIAEFLIKRADSVRAVSVRLQKEIVDNFGVQPEKITVVPIFSPKAASAPSSAKEKVAGKFVFLTVGRLVPVKNIILQIKAFGRLSKKYSQIELWIAGEGRETSNLKETAAALESADKIKFLGWQGPEELDLLYDQADCFLFTSNEEGYGLVAVEAASHGLPIIMTDVGLAGEFIRDGENGFVIPVGDEAALAESMEKVLACKDLAKEMGNRARLDASNLPDLKSVLRLYKESWWRAASYHRSINRHGFNLAVILLIAAMAVFIRYSTLPFTSTASDSVQYMETAKYFIGQGGDVYPQRILKPLAPLGAGLISYATFGNMETALLAEAAICYLALGWAVYFLLYLFFREKRPALFGAIIYITSYPLLRFGLDLYTETGANLFWVWAIAAILLYYRNPSRFRYYVSNAIILIGLLWKEYSLLGAALLWLVIFFHPQMPRPEKIKKIAISILMVFCWLALTQLIVYANYHYSYFNWYHAGTDISEGTDYHPYFIIKSLIAVYLLGWGMVICGLFRWRRFGDDQKFFIKCLILPSMMFLLWTGVSSRLYFVAAPLLTFLAVHGLKAQPFKRIWQQIAIVAIIVAGNIFWLFANENFRSLIQMSNWR